MIKEVKNSRFHPCPLFRDGQWCGGIAALGGVFYTCSKCETQWTTYGYPVGYEHPEPQETCTIEGCEKEHKARGMCHNHYQQWHYRKQKAKEKAA